MSTGSTAVPGTPRDEIRTVLVVDDEPHLVRLVSRTLERAGHRVLSAEDAPSAVATFTARHTEIDAVFLDVRIPPDGVDRALDEMLAVRSAIGVVLTSGDDLHADLRCRLAAQGGRFVRKPFATRDALRAVEAVLEEC